MEHNRKTKAGRGGAREGAGRKKTLTKAEKLVVGSIRMNPEQWKLFEKWGGAAKLREHLAKVKGGVARAAQA